MICHSIVALNLRSDTKSTFPLFNVSLRLDTDRRTSHWSTQRSSSNQAYLSDQHSRNWST